MRAGGEEATEDGMVGWHHQLNGHESEQTLGDGDGQGNLAWCIPWGHRVGQDWATEPQQNEYTILYKYIVCGMPQYVLKLNISNSFSQEINSVNDRYSLYCEYLGKMYKDNNCLKI